VQLTRGLDTNQVRIFENGFLADFIRGQGNLAAVRAERARIAADPTLTAAQRTAALALRPVSAAFNNLVPNSLALTIFPRLGQQGNLANGTIINLFDTGQVGELASNYVSSRNTFLSTAQPCVQGATGPICASASAAVGTIRSTTPGVKRLLTPNKLKLSFRHISTMQPVMLWRKSVSTRTCSMCLRQMRSTNCRLVQASGSLTRVDLSAS